MSARRSFSVDRADEPQHDTDAAGELRQVERVPAVIPSDVRSITTLDAPRMIARTFASNPFCIECGERIAMPKSAGLIQLPDSTYRVAHKTKCFAAAIQRLNPTFARAAAKRRQESPK